jgi:hypothetical protein
VRGPSETAWQSSRPPAALLDGDDPVLFPKLTEQQLELLRPLGQVRGVEIDEVLFRDGDDGYDPMVVLAGRIAVPASGAADSRDLVSQRPGDLMVELNLFTGQPVGATGVGREAGSVLVVPAEIFRRWLEASSLSARKDPDDLPLQSGLGRRHAYRAEPSNGCHQHDTGSRQVTPEWISFAGELPARSPTSGSPSSARESAARG